MTNKQQFAEAIQRAKELIQAPANRMPPSRFAMECQTLESQGVQVTILDQEALKKIGAQALLAVGRGSVNPPYLAILEWKGNEDPPIALVGKGICFDAGGIQLKTAYLEQMKWDKAGGGVVFGVLDALSRTQAPIHVVGVIPLAENMPGGNALHPGDVIDTLSGKTVEIVDTDCEGRLVLADAMTYVQREFDPSVIIDIGTLTLECFGALGNEYAGLFTPDKELQKDLLQAGETSGERLWLLPLGAPFAEALKTPFADLKNAALSRYGASSAAAEFLRSFVDENRQWAHLDIAGVAWDLRAPEKGVSGFGIQLLLDYLLG